MKVIYKGVHKTLDGGAVCYWLERENKVWENVRLKATKAITDLYLLRHGLMVRSPSSIYVRSPSILLKRKIVKQMFRY